MKRFDASLEWFLERVNLRDEEIKKEEDVEKEAREKDQIFRAKRIESIRDVIVDVEVLDDTHFFNEF